MLALKKISNAAFAALLVMLALMQGAYASEIDLKIPSLDVGYNIWGYAVTGSQILMYGIGICVLGMIFGFYEFVKIKKMPAHESMLNVSNLIYETCKTYMKQQAKLLLTMKAIDSDLCPTISNIQARSNLLCKNKHIHIISI